MRCGRECGIRSSGTALRLNDASASVIRGSLFVQSARSRTTPCRRSAARTSVEENTSALLLWQVAHQRAVKST